MFAWLRLLCTSDGMSDLSRCSDTVKANDSCCALTAATAVIANGCGSILQQVSSGLFCIRGALGNMLTATIVAVIVASFIDADGEHSSCFFHS